MNYILVLIVVVVVVLAVVSAAVEQESSSSINTVRKRIKHHNPEEITTDAVPRKSSSSSNNNNIQWKLSSDAEEEDDDETETMNLLLLLQRSIDSRIVGGDLAPIHAYPFFVNWGGCGASLISKEWILTAAHCNVIPFDWCKINQSRGSGNVGRGTTGYIEKRIPHPEYDRGTVNYDLMLMKLTAPTNAGTPVHLNFHPDIPIENDPLTVVGFGRLEAGGASADHLRQVEVRYVPTDECNAPESYDGGILDETMFCAGVDGGGKDSCQGDSGGPIFMKEEEEENASSSSDNNNNDSLMMLTQVGVVSFGEGCAEANYPGVYARVSAVKEWIKDTVCNDSSDEEELPDFCNDDDSSSSSSYDDDNNNGGDSSEGPPLSDGTNVQLRITFDEFPDETSWEFQQNGIQVARGSGGSSSSSSSIMPGQVKTYSYYMEPGEPTLFTIQDSMSDGICCDYGRGDYSIFVLVVDDDDGGGGEGEFIETETSDGNFGVFESKSFTVPTTTNNDNDNNDGLPPTPGPPPSSSSDNDHDDHSNNNNVGCEDSTTQEFLVDHDIGYKNCEWLSWNVPGNFDFLCKFFDVAVKCKRTCDVCIHFQ